MSRAAAAAGRGRGGSLKNSSGNVEGRGAALPGGRAAASGVGYFLASSIIALALSTMSRNSTRPVGLRTRRGPRTPSAETAVP